MFSTCGQHFYRWRFPSVERTFIISLKAVEHVDMQVKNLLSKSFFSIAILLLPFHTFVEGQLQFLLHFMLKFIAEDFVQHE